MKEQNKTVKRNIITTIAICVVYAITLVYQLVTKAPIAAEYYLAAFGCIIAFAFVFRKMATWQFVLIASNLVISNYFGSLLHFYSKFYYFDKVVHTMSGVSIVLAANFVVEHYYLPRHPDTMLPPSAQAFFATVFSVAGAGVWEIYEFTVDFFFQLDTQGVGQAALIDTMTDMMVGSLGGLVTGYILYRYLVARQQQKKQ